MDLIKLPNIGKILKKELVSVGIKNVEDLEKIGSKEAWKKLKESYDTTCLDKLYALTGALEGIRWHDLPEEIKKELKFFYRNYN